MSDLETPFPYQLIGADFLAAHPQALLADDMGLGKSCQAVRGCDLVGARNVLVLCPGSVRVNWEREFAKFSPLDRPCAIIFTGKDPIPKAGVVICSYDLLQAHAHTMKGRKWDVIILDESHMLKERTAARTKAVYGRSRTLPGIVASAARVWRLTGTPAPNDASELWTHLKSAGLCADSYWDFTFHFCAGFESSFGFKVTGMKNVPELQALLGKFMLRRKKEDVLKDLPPIRYQQVTVERSEVDLTSVFFEELKTRSEADVRKEIAVQGQTLSAALGAIAATAGPGDALAVLEAQGQSMTTLRRYTAMAKLPAILAILQEELKSGALDKIVLFAYHQCVVEEAALCLKNFGAVTVYGKTPQGQRQKNIDKFAKDPKCRVFIGNITAAGVGINGLQDSCCEAAALEQDWVPANNMQAFMRVHRLGQTRPVRVRIFSLHQSSDEQVQEALTRKARELTKIF